MKRFLFYLFNLKNVILFLVVYCLCVDTFCQKISIIDTVESGSARFSKLRMALGADGAIYKFRYNNSIHEKANIDYGLGETLVSKGFIISKHSPSGELLWYKTIDDPYDFLRSIYFMKIEVDAFGDVIVGFVYGTSSNRPLDFNTTVVSNAESSGPYSVFLKLDEDGNYLWGNKTRSYSIDDFKTDSKGNIVIVGKIKFSSSMDFDFTEGVLNSQICFEGSSSSAIFKIDKDGKPIWNKHKLCKTFSLYPDLLIDDSDNIYLSSNNKPYELHQFFDVQEEFIAVKDSTESLNIVKLDSGGHFRSLFSIKLNKRYTNIRDQIFTDPKTISTFIKYDKADTVCLYNNGQLLDSLVDIPRYSDNTYDELNLVINLDTSMESFSFDSLINKVTASIYDVQKTEENGFLVLGKHISSSDTLIISNLYFQDTIIAPQRSSILYKLDSTYNIIWYGLITSDVEGYNLMLFREGLGYANNNRFYWWFGINNGETINVITPTEKINVLNDKGFVILEVDGVSSHDTIITSYSVDRAVKNDIDIYPNPTTDKLIIENPLNEGFSVKLLNAEGTLIFNDRLKKNEKFILNMFNYPSGLYFIEINNLSSQFHKKIIKQ